MESCKIRELRFTFSAMSHFDHPDASPPLTTATGQSHDYHWHAHTNETSQWVRLHVIHVPVVGSYPAEGGGGGRGVQPGLVNFRLHRGGGLPAIGCLCRGRVEISGGRICLIACGNTPVLILPNRNLLMSLQDFVAEFLGSFQFW